MISPLKFAIALVLLAFPIVEIALLIKAGSAIGVWPVLLIIITTAIVGANVIRARGLSVFSRVFAHMEAGQSGFEPLADTFLAVSGGVLLILPGLICDVLGGLLLVAPIRSLLVRAGIGRALAGGGPASRGDFEAGVRQSSTRQPPAPGRGSTIIIDGEYEHIDEKKGEGSNSPHPRRR